MVKNNKKKKLVEDIQFYNKTDKITNRIIRTSLHSKRKLKNKDYIFDFFIPQEIVIDPNFKANFDRKGNLLDTLNEFMSTNEGIFNIDHKLNFDKNCVNYFANQICNYEEQLKKNHLNVIKEFPEKFPKLHILMTEKAELDLLSELDIQPSLKLTSTKYGVSVNTVYRYFKNFHSM